MSRDKIPVTPALLTLKKNQMVFATQPYKYVEHERVTSIAAKALGVDEHEVIKTLVMVSPSELIRVLHPVPAKVSVGS